ncbi:unnamed protein product [Schistocephalus solidus]|uniref:Ecdysone-induced protein 74EF n=1 Tax=Schistocephalus solidus TaxID=70667 RepID=A0A183TJV9_SCHSO|nr:unnamed protein product [Schistocephalus solidus]
MSGISNVSTCAASLGLRPGQLLTAAPATGGLGEVEIIGKKPPTEISAMDSEKLQILFTLHQPDHENWTCQRSKSQPLLDTTVLSHALAYLDGLTASEPKKMSDCGSCLKFAGDVEAHSESSLYPPSGVTTGAAIYGQLVTADQLEQQGGLTGGSACITGTQALLHRSPSQKSQQQQALRSKLAALNAAIMTTAAVITTSATAAVAVATTMPSPLTGSVCSSNSSVTATASATTVTATTTSHLPPPSPSSIAVMSLSAYAKLDPSYSLKNCAVGAKVTQQPHQQQSQLHICHRPVAYHHPMDVVGDSEKARPTAMGVAVGSGQPGSPSSNSIVNKSVNNTYSYPIFPYATVTTVEAGSSTAFVGHVKDSCEGLLMASAVAPSLQPHQQHQSSRAAEAMSAAAPPPINFPRRPSQQRVLVKMSVKLIQTYENINEVGFAFQLPR